MSPHPKMGVWFFIEFLSCTWCILLYLSVTYRAMVYFIDRGFVRNKMSSQQVFILTVIFSSFFCLCASPPSDVFSFVCTCHEFNLLILFLTCFWKKNVFEFCKFILFFEIFIGIFSFAFIFISSSFQDFLFQLFSYFFPVISYIKISTPAKITF